MTHTHTHQTLRNKGVTFCRNLVLFQELQDHSKERIMGTLAQDFHVTRKTRSKAR